jgi:hypothetical protein
MLVLVIEMPAKFGNDFCTGYRFGFGNWVQHLRARSAQKVISSSGSVTAVNLLHRDPNLGIPYDTVVALCQGIPSYERKKCNFQDIYKIENVIGGLLDVLGFFHDKNV